MCGDLGDLRGEITPIPGFLGGDLLGVDFFFEDCGTGFFLGAMSMPICHGTGTRDIYI